MQIKSDRFGTIEVEDAEAIHFPMGIIGFPEETSFVLIRHGESSVVAWLQSTESSALAFPVVSAHGLANDYPDIELGPVADQAGLGDEESVFAVLAVLSANRGVPATVNLVAPIIINAESRMGAQIFLEGSRFTTRELFVLPNAEAPSDASEEEESVGNAMSRQPRESVPQMAASSAAE